MFRGWEEAKKQVLMPVLDEVARRCRVNDEPLLTVLTTRFEDGSVDLAAARRHWLIRYEKPLPSEDWAAELVIEAEVQKCYGWQEWKGVQ